MKLTVYGIPSCGTCKKARAWLDEQGHAHDWVDLRDAPPSKARVGRWVKAFGTKPLRNTSGGSYRALGAKKDGFSDADWTAAFGDDPMLIKRPVLEIDGKPAAVGFKLDAWTEALGGGS